MLHSKHMWYCQIHQHYLTKTDRSLTHDSTLKWTKIWLFKKNIQNIYDSILKWHFKQRKCIITTFQIVSWTSRKKKNSTVRAPVYTGHRITCAKIDISNLVLLQAKHGLVNGPSIYLILFNICQNNFKWTQLEQITTFWTTKFGYFSQNCESNRSKRSSLICKNVYLHKLKQRIQSTRQK